jgi:hypothetical protein
MKIKSAIVEQYGLQVVASRHLGTREARLGDIVRGHVEPYPEEPKVLERALGRSVVQKGRSR